MLIDIYRNGKITLNSIESELKHCTFSPKISPLAKNIQSTFSLRQQQWEKNKKKKVCLG
jgi:hypothetical protein